jgi:thiol-disulfide isomerase/thioredoxin
LKLSEYRGKVVLLVFWADWSPYCRQLYPDLQRLAKRIGDNAQFSLLGVNSDRDRNSAQSVIRQLKITWPNWWDDPSRRAVSSQWGVETIPYLFLLDATGVIRFKVAGLPEDANVLDKAIAELLAELNPGIDSKSAVPAPSGQERD